MTKNLVDEGVITINHENKTASFSPLNTCFHVPKDYDAMAKIIKERTNKMTITNFDYKMKKDDYSGWSAETRHSMGMVTNEGKQRERVLTLRTSKGRYS